ncbi:25155_t:CDS:1 [Gigaspora margarita]|uniref:25155_t:CDS:1 n=1 Tax=Gigaspora margarita TaxID=4874 RepID=A0ABN7VK34_GIGMA|nr:25155_t:CDS:1 [Gigaspora margarita]
MYLIVYEELQDGSTAERSMIDPKFPKYRTDEVCTAPKKNNRTKIPEDIRKIPTTSSTNFTPTSNKTSLNKTVTYGPIPPLINTADNKDSCQEIQTESNGRRLSISIDRELISDLKNESERNENMSMQKIVGNSNGTHVLEIITIPDDDDETSCHSHRANYSFYTDVNVLSPTSSLDIELGSEVSDLEEIDLGKSMWEVQKHKDSQPNVQEGLNIIYASEIFCLPVVKEIIEIGSSSEESESEVESSLAGDSDEEMEMATSSDDDYYTGFRIYDLITDNNPDTMLQLINNSMPYDIKKLKQKRSIINSVGTVKRRKTRS